MFKTLELITTVAETNRKTMYFFNRKNKILLAIDDKTDDFQPSIYNTLYRTIKALGFGFSHLRIYFESNGVFYAYLNIASENLNMDINIKFRDGIKLSRKYDLPILINEELLQKEGIPITKSMILTSLELTGP